MQLEAESDQEERNGRREDVKHFLDLFKKLYALQLLGRSKQFCIMLFLLPNVFAKFF